MLDFELLWWHWLVAGLVLLFLDLLLINSFFIVWLGLGAVPVFLSLLLWPAMPFWGQTLIWIVSCSLLIASWRFFHKGKPGSDDSINAMLGLSCIVVGWHQGSGQVRLQRPYQGHDVWNATSNEDIAQGETCKITQVNEQADMVTLAKA